MNTFTVNNSFFSLSLFIQNEEWEQFQSDLLMTVRVANDLKTEAQTQSEMLIAENKELKEKVKVLEVQVDKLKGILIKLIFIF